MPSTNDPTLKDFFAQFGRGSTYSLNQAEIKQARYPAVFNLTTTDAQAEVAFAAPGRVQPRNLVILPHADLATHNDNHVTVTIKKKGADGAGTTVIASWTSDGNGGGSALTKWVAKRIACTAGVRLLAGEVLTITIAKGGTGCTFNAEVFVEYADLVSL